MSRTRWFLLLPVLLLLAALAWWFWPRADAPFPYEGVNDPAQNQPTIPHSETRVPHRELRDAGSR
jgi:hypothetical protein